MCCCVINIVQLDKSFKWAVVLIYTWQSANLHTLSILALPMRHVPNPPDHHQKSCPYKCQWDCNRSEFITPCFQVNGFAMDALKVSLLLKDVFNIISHGSTRLWIPKPALELAMLSDSNVWICFLRQCNSSTAWRVRLPEAPAMTLQALSTFQAHETIKSIHI